MSKNILIGGVIVVVIVGAMWMMTHSDDAMMSDDAVMMQGDSMVQDGTAMEAMESDRMTGDAMMQMEAGDAMMGDTMTDDAMMQASGVYTAYDAETMTQLAAEGKRVVLFFHAPWCPTCKALDADIRAHMNEIPADVAIMQVNYDTATALKQKYGVTYQHTLVQVDGSGVQVVKWDSSRTLKEFLTHVE